MANDQYEQRVVLFLDILGFKRLIDQQQEGIVSEVLSVTSSKYAGYDISAFSDNMAVSIKIETGDELLKIIEFASYLIWQLMSKGVLSRGAVAVGDLHHRNGIIYGPALLNAYYLESQVATFPRVILEKDVIKKFSAIRSIPAVTENSINALLHEDESDGWKYIHLMSHHAKVPNTMLAPDDDNNVSYQNLIEAKVAVARKALSLNAAKSMDIRAATKHEWMGRYVSKYENYFNHLPDGPQLEWKLAIMKGMPNHKKFDEVIMKLPEGDSGREK